MSEKEIEDLRVQELKLQDEICLLESQQIEIEEKLEVKWKELRTIVESKV